MDAQIKAKWIAALRSGEYQQGVRLLLHCGRHCCIGVLREVVSPGDLVSLDNEGRVMTGEQLEKATLTKIAQAILTTMNDSGKKFPEIADYIESNL